MTGNAGDVVDAYPPPRLRLVRRRPWRHDPLRRLRCGTHQRRRRPPVLPTVPRRVPTAIRPVRDRVAAATPGEPVRRGPVQRRLGDFMTWRPGVKVPARSAEHVLQRGIQGHALRHRPFLGVADLRRAATHPHSTRALRGRLCTVHPLVAHRPSPNPPQCTGPLTGRHSGQHDPTRAHRLLGYTAPLPHNDLGDSDHVKQHQ